MKRIVRTYSIILAIDVVAYLVRWASGQFSTEFNNILFVVAFLWISFSWEVLRQINRLLNKFLPFEKNIPGRIAVQLALGTVFALTARFLLYKYGEQYLPFK